MGKILAENAGYVADAMSATSCEYCPHKTGADYAKLFNLNEKGYRWRDIGIMALFIVSWYAMVFVMMKLRSKAKNSPSR